MQRTAWQGSMTLDPVCGSGTWGVAALKLGRRFICIDREPAAILIAKKRLEAQTASGDYVQCIRTRDNQPSEIIYLGISGSEKAVLDWDDGNSYVVLGDALEVMHTMPDGFVELVYADPPYGTGKEFRDKNTGVGFSDVWKWDDAAEQRLVEIAALPAAAIAEPVSVAIDFINLVRRMDKRLASYLTWVTLLTVECRRVMS